MFLEGSMLEVLVRKQASIVRRSGEVLQKCDMGCIADVATYHTSAKLAGPALMTH